MTFDFIENRRVKYFYTAPYLIFFDLLKNAVCIPCPINNNFELETSLLQ